MTRDSRDQRRMDHVDDVGSDRHAGLRIARSASVRENTDTRDAVSRRRDGSRLRCVLHLLATALTLTFISLSAHGANYALVIGISKYDYDGTREGIIPLQYPDDDARDLKEVLEANGYTVFSQVDDDAEREDIIRAFTELRDLVTEEDSFILFFAGHGMRDARIDRTFWLTHDTRLSSLDHNGIRLSHLMDYIDDVRARRKLVLLDHCFSGDVRFESLVPGDSRTIDFASPNITRGALPVEELQTIDLDQSSGLAILAAARDQAFENDEYQNGVFTEALIRAMASRDADTDDDGNLSLVELEQFLSSEIAALSDESGTSQRPVSVVNAQGMSDWILFPLPEAALNAEEISAEYKALLARWATQTPPWISPEVKFRIYRTLIAWVQAEANLAALNGVDRLAMVNLQDSMAFFQQGLIDENILADALNNELKHIYGFE